MRILLLSLLRTGDLFMQGLLVSKIRESYPNSEIHILINDLNVQSVELIPGIDKVHILNRSYLQKYLVEENRPWIRAYENLRKLIQNLNAEKFDLICNLTHNFFSARLMDLIEAKEKRGARFQNDQAVVMLNPWASYCNTHFSLSNKSQFHYLQVLARSLEFESPAPLVQKVASSANRVCFQVLTSDLKKNWPFPSFQHLIQLLSKKYPQYQMTVLGAPDEKEKIQSFFTAGNKIEILFPRWNELPYLFQQTRLLVTGDTSVQHLAVQYSVPILSLFLGSANPQKTGPYQEGAIVLQSRTPCAPCSHAFPCFQQSQLCAQDLKPEEVLRACEYVLDGKVPMDMRSHLFQVQRGIFKQFSLRQILAEDFMQNFEQTVWQIYLDGGFKEIVGPYGSSARFFQGCDLNWVQKKVEQNHSDKMLIEEIEQRVLRAASNISYDESVFQFAVRDCSEILKNYLIGRSFSKDYFLSLEFAFSEQAAALFPLLRKIKSAIQEARNLLNVESKLIQTIQNEKKERRQGNVSGIRKIPEVSSPQT